MKNEETFLLLEQQDRRIGKLFADYVVLLLEYNLFRRMFKLGTLAKLSLLLVLLFLFLWRNRNILINVVRQYLAQIIIMESGCMILYLLSYLRGGIVEKDAVVYMAYSGIICVPIMVAGMKVSDIKNIYEELKKASYSILFLAGFVIIAKLQTGEMYNMQYSYEILLPLIVFTNEYLEERRFKYIFFIIYLFLLMVLFGSRGPLLCYVLFCILRLYTGKKNLDLKLMCLMLSAVIITQWENIGTLLTYVLDMLDIQSRTLKLLFNNLFYTSGRNEITQKAIELLKNKWLFGCGIATDIKMIGTYPHNIFIEILYDFGYIMGSFLIIVLIYFIIHFLNVTERGLAWVLISFCFFPLLISGTYLKSAHFFFLIGICINTCSKRKNLKSNFS